MNDPEIFFAGALVTLVVVFALVIVIWGAVMDGREAPHEDPLAQVPAPPSSQLNEMRSVDAGLESVPSRHRVDFQHSKPESLRM